MSKPRRPFVSTSAGCDRDGSWRGKKERAFFFLLGGKRKAWVDCFKLHACPLTFFLFKRFTLEVLSPRVRELFHEVPGDEVCALGWCFHQRLHFFYGVTLNSWLFYRWPASCAGIYFFSLRSVHAVAFKLVTWPFQASELWRFHADQNSHCCPRICSFFFASSVCSGTIYLLPARILLTRIQDISCGLYPRYMNWAALSVGRIVGIGRENGRMSVYIDTL